MGSQTTKLELGIVATVLLLLFLCRQPPKSGNADVRRDVGPMQQAPVARVQVGGYDTEDTAALNPQSAIRDPQLVRAEPPTTTAPVDAAASHNATGGSPIPPPPQVRRLGLVDARKCPGLNYNDILYGEVTLRWVWDGSRFVLHKVVEVREKSGAISTWTFEDRDDIVTTEIPQ